LVEPSRRSCHGRGGAARTAGAASPAPLRDGTPADDLRDFVSGMTDAFAVNLYEQLFTPRRWYVL
jgi:dGTP triphosphohydrolase